MLSKFDEILCKASLQNSFVIVLWNKHSKLANNYKKEVKKYFSMYAKHKHFDLFYLLA